MATIPSLASYNVNPSPLTVGQGAYGAVPGPIGLPPSTYSQVGDVLPSLDQLTSQAGNVVGSQLAGQVPSGTIGQIQDAAAAFGVGSGMPGSGLSANLGAETLGLDAMKLQQQGLQNYQSLIPSIGSTMLSPNLVSGIAQQNALLGAAPDPGQAANVLTSLANPKGGGGITIGGGGGGGAKTVPGVTTNNPQLAAQQGLPLTGATGTPAPTTGSGTDAAGQSAVDLQSLLSYLSGNNTGAGTPTTTGTGDDFTNSLDAILAGFNNLGPGASDYGASDSGANP
jgi:hypothetical protein